MAPTGMKEILDGWNPDWVRNGRNCSLMASKRDWAHPTCEFGAGQHLLPLTHPAAAHDSPHPTC